MAFAAVRSDTVFGHLSVVVILVAISTGLEFQIGSIAAFVAFGTVNFLVFAFQFVFSP